MGDGRCNGLVEYRELMRRRAASVRLRVASARYAASAAAEFCRQGNGAGAGRVLEGVADSLGEAIDEMGEWFKDDR